MGNNESPLLLAQRVQEGLSLLLATASQLRDRGGVLTPTAVEESPATNQQVEELRATVSALTSQVERLRVECASLRGERAVNPNNPVAKDLVLVPLLLARSVGTTVRNLGNKGIDFAHPTIRKPIAQILNYLNTPRTLAEFKERVVAVPQSAVAEVLQLLEALSRNGLDPADKGARDKLRLFARALEGAEQLVPVRAGGEKEVKAELEAVLAAERAELDRYIVQEMQSLSEILRELDEAFAPRLQELAEQRNALEELDAELKAYEQRLAHAQAEIDRSWQKVRDAEEQLTQSRTELSQRQRAVEREAAVAATVMAEAETRRNELQAREAAVAKRAEEVISAEEQVANREKQLADREKELESRESKLQEDEAALNSLWSELEAGKAELASRQADMRREASELHLAQVAFETERKEHLTRRKDAPSVQPEVLQDLVARVAALEQTKSQPPTPQGKAVRLTLEEIPVVEEHELVGAELVDLIPLPRTKCMALKKKLEALLPKVNESAIRTALAQFIVVLGRAAHVAPGGTELVVDLTSDEADAGHALLAKLAGEVKSPDTATLMEFAKLLRPTVQ